MRRPFDARTARRVAQAAGSFEHGLLGRVPTSVTVVVADDSLVLHLHEGFTPVERHLAGRDAGRRRVEAFHQAMFEQALDSLVEHVRRTAGVHLRGALAHVDAATGSVVKTFTTHAAVDLFLLGPALPSVGVPVDAHRHAHGSRTTEGDVPVRCTYVPDGPAATKG